MIVDSDGDSELMMVLISFCQFLFQGLLLLIQLTKSNAAIQVSHGFTCTS